MALARKRLGLVLVVVRDDFVVAVSISCLVGLLDFFLDGNIIIIIINGFSDQIFFLLFSFSFFSFCMGARVYISVCLFCELVLDIKYV